MVPKVQPAGRRPNGRKTSYTKSPVPTTSPVALSGPMRTLLDLSRTDDRIGKELERAAHLCVRQVAEARHQEKRIDADGLEVLDLGGDLIRRTDHHAADHIQLVVGLSAPDAA